MKHIRLPSLGFLKTNADRLAALDPDLKHGQALDSFARLCGYAGYEEALALPSVKAGEPISLNDLATRLLVLFPSARVDDAFALAQELALHTEGTDDDFAWVLEQKRIQERRAEKTKEAEDKHKAQQAAKAAERNARAAAAAAVPVTSKAPRRGHVLREPYVGPGDNKNTPQE